VAVIGSYNTGFLIHVDRLPVRGETVPGHGFRMEHGGKGSNQAIQCARLGCRTSMIARVGRDIFGDRALEKWAEEGVDTRGVVRDEEEPTGAGLIMVGPGGANMIAVDLAANLRLSRRDVERSIDIIAESDVVVSVFEIRVETALYALRRAAELGAKTILNPAPASRIRPKELEGITVITPNEVEMMTLAGLGSSSERELSKAAEDYLGAVEHVVITLGERGAMIVDDVGARVVQPPRIEAVDTTGAGDAFNGALATALSWGMSIDDAVRYGCLAGAFLSARIRRGELVESLGHRDELERFSEKVGYSIGRKR